MTIKELVAMLITYPQDMKVLVDSYEDGYDEMIFKEAVVSCSTNDNWFQGIYQDSPFDASEKICVLVLAREPPFARKAKK